MERNNFLLDTHVFIWAMEENKRLSEEVKQVILNPHNNIFVSSVTLWEIIIKETTKQIRFSFNLEESIKQAGLEILPIHASHALYLKNLPLYHMDPFDRMLIAQAKVEHMQLITADKKIFKYDVKIIRL